VFVLIVWCYVVCVLTVVNNANVLLLSSPCLSLSYWLSFSSILKAWEHCVRLKHSTIASYRTIANCISESESSWGAAARFPISSGSRYPPPSLFLAKYTFVLSSSSRRYGLRLTLRFVLWCSFVPKEAAFDRQLRKQIATKILAQITNWALNFIFRILFEF